MLSEFLRISPRISVLPIIHGSGDFAVEVRRVMLSSNFDCLAVPLPPSFQDDVERAVDLLPSVTAVLQSEPLHFDREWTPEEQESEEPEAQRACSYVPIDPCQGVIAAIRIAQGEQIPRAFIDLETAEFEPMAAILPDPYALKRVPAELFSAAVLPAIPRPGRRQQTARCRTMAARLRLLEKRYSSILFVASIMDWPWIREAYHEVLDTDEDDDVEATQICSINPSTLVFLLGELPFVTAQYEQARANLDDDENLSIDGVKALLLAARDRYRLDLKSRARSVTPKLMSAYFQYVRNLSLVERRLTPDLYSLIVGSPARSSAISSPFTWPRWLANTSMPRKARIRRCRWASTEPDCPTATWYWMKNRLPGQSVVWRKCELRPRPPKPEQLKWLMRWNPYSQCSWPPEDVAIERFRTHVKDAALALSGQRFGADREVQCQSQGRARYPRNLAELAHAATFMSAFIRRREAVSTA